MGISQGEGISVAGVRSILFDLDGTLVDSLSLIRETYQVIFQRMNIPWRNGEVMRFIGVSLREIALRYAGPKAGEFIRLYQSEYERRHDARTQAFPGSDAILDSLGERGYQIGIVTSKGRHGACLAIRHLDWELLIDLLVTADDVKRAKPHPEPVLKALQALDTPADETLFIGDSCFDFEAGRRAGVRTLAVTWGLTPADELAGLGVDGILHRWMDIESYLV